MANDDPRDAAESVTAPRPGKRLPDRLLAAFHVACDQGELDVAAQVLRALETLVARGAPAADPNRRRSLDALVAAHERLWRLRHPGHDGA